MKGRKERLFMNPRLEKLHYSGEFCKTPNNTKSAQVGFVRKCVQPPTEQKKVPQVDLFLPESYRYASNDTSDSSNTGKYVIWESH